MKFLLFFFIACLIAFRVSADTIALNFDSTADFAYLNERVAHNDPGFPAQTTHIANGKLYNVGSNFAFKEPIVGKGITLSVDFSLTQMDATEFPIQIGFTTGYSSYSSSNGTIPGDEYGTLFGPGTEFAFYLLHKEPNYPEIHYSTKWGSQITDTSYGNFDLEEHTNLNWTLTYTTREEDDGWGEIIIYGTILATLTNRDTGVVLYSRTFDESIHPDAKASFSTLTAPVYIDTATVIYEDVTPPRFNLRVTAAVGGKVTPFGSQDYTVDTSVSLAASANPGYLFKNWSGDADGSTNPLPVIVAQDLNIAAEFGPDFRDSDGDGLSNYQEIIVFGTDPNKADSSGDGMTDGELVAAGFDPTNDFSTLLSLMRSKLEDARTGSAMIDVNGSSVRLHLQIERSTDLVSWTSAPEDIFEFEIPVSERTGFFRFAMPTD
jgi:hypothetical protein